MLLCLHTKEICPLIKGSAEKAEIVMLLYVLFPMTVVDAAVYLACDLSFMSFVSFQNY